MLTHMCVFRYIVYVMVSNGKKDKLVLKGSKCLLFGYFEDTIKHWLMCMQIKKLLKKMLCS